MKEFLEKARVGMAEEDYDRLETLAEEFLTSGRGANLYQWFKDETSHHTNWVYKCKIFGSFPL